MPVLVHLADERNAATIRKNGVKIGKARKGIYCMPVLQEFFVSYQWLRELKRDGVKTFVGVHFKLKSDTMVYAGRYNKSHRYIALGQAIKEIMTMNDPLGYEIIIDRKILSSEITKIKHLPQNVGWRYMPGSNGKRPQCACPFCIPVGSIKGKRLREKFDPSKKQMSFAEILEKIRLATKDQEIEDLLWEIQLRRRRSNPVQLLFLLERNSNIITEALADTLSFFKHKNSKKMLLDLINHSNTAVKKAATESLLTLYGANILNALKQYNNNAVTDTAAAWEEKKTRT